MAWVNGQWVDDDELQGMLYSGVTPTLPFYDQSSFTSPLSTLNQEAAGNFNMWGSPSVAFGNQGVRPQFDSPTGGASVPIGSDYDAGYLNRTLNSLYQDVPSNVVPITPTEDVNLAGMPFAGAVTGANELINKAPFVSANPLSVLAKTEMLPNIFNYDAGPVVQNVFDTIMPTADAAEKPVSPQTSSLTPFASQSSITPATSSAGLNAMLSRRFSQGGEGNVISGSLSDIIRDDYGSLPSGPLDVVRHFDLSNVPGGRFFNSIREVSDDPDTEIADYIRDLQIDKFKEDNLGATKQDVLNEINKPNQKTFLTETDEAFAEKIRNARKSDEKMIAKAKQQKKDADARAKTAAAASRRSKQMADKKAAQRQAMLARKAAAALAADKAAAKAEKAFVASLDDEARRGWRSLSSAERRAASTGYGEGRGFMGADIGHDEGGYTGGDFSSGAGWE
tara:strand:+ start:99 stop:1448 length:1350 start_codon:yes stop_codon:yes gene_type:complete